jgi:hypothetical protein
MSRLRAIGFFLADAWFPLGIGFIAGYIFGLIVRTIW